MPFPPVPTGKNVAIILITKLLSVLQAENNIYYLGQPILAIDDTTGKTGIKIGDWDWANEAPEAATPFNDLPWLITPQASGSLGFTPFKVRTTDDSYAVDGDGNITITDARLVGITDPVVYYTGQGVDLRDNAMAVDPDAGTISIPVIGPMDPTDHFSIFIPSAIVSPDLTALTARVALLEKAMAPVTGGLGIMIFRGTLEQAMALENYTIITEAEGKALFGFKEDDPNFGILWNTTGNAGAVSVKLAANQIPELDFDLDAISGNHYVGSEDATGAGMQLVGQNLEPVAPQTKASVTMKAGTAAADLQAIPTVPPHLEVFFLQWTP